LTIKTHQPCPDCGSSDGLAIYDNGTHCFVCKKSRLISKKVLDKSDDLVYNSPYVKDAWGFVPHEHTKNNLSSNNINNILPKDTMDSNYTYDYIPIRGLILETLKLYDIKTKIDAQGNPVSLGFVYPNKAVKVRNLKEKEFFANGPMSEAACFGTDKFSAGMSKSITITEGEIDAASVYQMLGSKYPSISVRSSSSAKRDCERDHEYINSFDQIYLCFDSDEPGQKALQDVARLFDPNKVFHVRLTKFKDANDYLVNGAEKEFTNCWYNARKFLPKGIVSGYKDIEEILNKKDKGIVAHFPFKTLDDMAYGIRFGEIVLFTAQEKVGKTEIIRAIEYHLLQTTDHNIGIIHLEETEKRSVQGLIGYQLNTPVHLPTGTASMEEQMEAFRKLTKKDGRLHFYTHFGSDDPDAILGVVRYLVAVCGCKFVFLDHITMLVTGFEGDDERKKLDYISTRLAMMVKELDFTLFLVSHVNDQGQTRGSRNIGKIADLLLHLERDIQNPSQTIRNQTTLTCRGNRFGGVTGPAGLLQFDPASFQVKEKKAEPGQDEVEPFSHRISMEEYGVSTTN